MHCGSVRSVGAFGSVKKLKNASAKTTPPSVSHAFPRPLTDGGSGYEALRLMPTAPSVKGRRKAWLTDWGAFRGRQSLSSVTVLTFAYVF